MTQFSRTHLVTAVVTALLAMTAVSAQATMTSVSDDDTIAGNQGANNEAYLSVYDPGQGKTYVLDLGATWGTIDGYKSNANPGLTYNLSTLGGDNGANWNAFKSGISNFSAVKYVVAVTDRTREVSITGNSPFNLTGRVYNDGETVNNVASAVGGRTDEYDNQVSTGDLITDDNSLNSSHIFLDSAAFPGGAHEQDPLNTAGLNIGSIGVWGGWANPGSGSGATNVVAFDPNGIYGNSVGFQWAHDGGATPPVGTGTGNSAGSYVATWTLAGDTLTFGTPVATVPLPAAVWMFGAGLVGMLGLNRRKGLSI